MYEDKEEIIKHHQDEVATPKSEQEVISNSGNVQKSPVIGVKSVQIQNIKPNGRQSKQQKTANAIKHVD